MRLLVAIALLLCLAASAWAQPAGIPSQSGNTKNQEVTATGASAVVTLTGALHTRARLYSIDARCGAGTSTLTVTDAGTTIWSTATGAVGTSVFTKAWSPPLTGTISSNLVVTLTTCGGGNVGTLDVQADIY